MQTDIDVAIESINKGRLPVFNNGYYNIFSNENHIIEPNKYCNIRTGLKIYIPYSCMGILSQSSQQSNEFIVNGVIKYGDTNEICVTIQSGDNYVNIKRHVVIAILAIVHILNCNVHILNSPNDIDIK